MDFSNLNFVAILVAALVAFVFGAAWYNPKLFGKKWQSDLGFTDEYLQEGNMAKKFGLSFVMMLLMALGLGLLLHGHPELSDQVDWRIGLHHGLLIGVLFAGASIAINYLYQQRPFRLWAIDAGYQIIFLGIMGAIIGGWH